MLIQFNFSNYKSFKNNVSLDLKATKISEHSDQVVNIANNKVLRVAALYGANASGKSNVHDAFSFMTYYVINSFKFGGEREAKGSKESEQIEVTPFLFDMNSSKDKTTFEVFFVDQSDESQKSYQYGFSLKGTAVMEEWLNYKTKTAREYKKIFYRENDQLELEGIPQKSEENIRIALEKETLVVSLGALLKVSKLKTIQDWFYNNEVIDVSNPVESYFRANRMPEKFDTDIEVQNKVVKFFASFDEDSIKGFVVEKLVTDGEKTEGERYRIRTKHKIIGTDEMALIPLETESQGTLEMFSLYPSIQEVLEKGSVLFVDELNTKLHPLLVRNIIRTFTDPTVNTKNAQLIFTTHDVWQMDNNLLRRDEIWFTEKDANGVSKLFSLAECNPEGIKIRKDENYEKNYLSGKYGAIPKIHKIDIFKS